MRWTRARKRMPPASIEMNLRSLPVPPTSRMVAANLASGSAAFREKLREKLEATGGVACKINIGGPGGRKEGKSGEESEKGSRRCVHAEQRLVSDRVVTTEKRDAHRRKKDADGARTSSSKRKSAASPDGGDGAEAEGRQDSKRWRKKELSVTIDEADNCFLGENGKKSGAAVVVPPEDTPRRVGSPNQARTVPL